MILYDKNGQIIAMGDISLGLLEFKDVNDFLRKHKDLDELVLDYKAWTFHSLSIEKTKFKSKFKNKKWQNHKCNTQTS